MSDYVYLSLAAPLAAERPADLEEQVRMLLGPSENQRASRVGAVALTPYLHIETPEVPDLERPVMIVRDTLFVDAMTINTNRRRDGRPSAIAQFFALLAPFCTAPAGAVLGGINGDWSMGYAGPVFVTDTGILAISGDAEAFADEGHWSGVHVPTASSLPAEVVGPLKSENGDWAWVPPATLDQIVEWAKKQEKAQA